MTLEELAARSAVHDLHLVRARLEEIVARPPLMLDVLAVQRLAQVLRGAEQELCRHHHPEGPQHGHPYPY